jgi:hypothetical protein
MVAARLMRGLDVTGALFAALVNYELAAAHGIVPEQKARDGHRDNDEGPKEKTE